jgi:hypothetical protein
MQLDSARWDCFEIRVIGSVTDLLQGSESCKDGIGKVRQGTTGLTRIGEGGWVLVDRDRGR